MLVLVVLVGLDLLEEFFAIDLLLLPSEVGLLGVDHPQSREEWGVVGCSIAHNKYNSWQLQFRILLGQSMGKVTRSASKKEDPTKADDKLDDVKRAKKKEPSEEKPKKKVKTNTKDQQPADKQPKQQAKQPAKKQEEEQLKKVVMKGTIPVDQHFFKASSATVLTDNGITYAATLNQSNIANNNNKFYILQVLEIEGSPKQYYFFTRWGRVGVVGQMAPQGPIPKQAAINQYHSKLRDKTRGGEYRVVEMNYESNDKEEQPKQVEKKNEVEVKSELCKQVQDLIKLIFDMKMMDKQMKEIGYDAKKMPLGKLAKSSILKGYEALKGLMDEVKGKKQRNVLQKYSSDFYSYIPHDFGFVKMQNFILDTEKKIKEKLQMLQSLQDIQIFTKILDEGKISQDINEMDSNYLKLNTEMEPLDKNDAMYQVLIDYVKNTHADTHNNYELEVEQIFNLKKQNQHQRFKTNIGNNQLLWHGSRLTNYVGILSQGLRIAPPQAPVTGYMFGKGVYFADMVSKSANYCFTNKLNNTGLMLLCEVALGNINQKKNADYYANLLPAGKSSTKGVGKCAPQNGVMVDKMFIPNGKGKPTGITDTSLLYNEFIVYDISQIICRYLFKMKFHFKH